MQAVQRPPVELTETFDDLRGGDGVEGEGAGGPCWSMTIWWIDGCIRVGSGGISSRGGGRICMDTDSCCNSISELLDIAGNTVGEKA